MADRVRPSLFGGVAEGRPDVAQMSGSEPTLHPIMLFIDTYNLSYRDELEDSRLAPLGRQVEAAMNASAP